MGEDHLVNTREQAHRTPWNKGKLIGAKPPLRPSHVWSIRAKLQMAGRKRDLALFNLAIDSKLRGRDVVALRASPSSQRSCLSGVRLSPPRSHPPASPSAASSRSL